MTRSRCYNNAQFDFSVFPGHVLRRPAYDQTHVELVTDDAPLVTPLRAIDHIEVRHLYRREVLVFIRAVQQDIRLDPSSGNM